MDYLSLLHIEELPRQTRNPWTDADLPFAGARIMTLPISQ